MGLFKHLFKKEEAKELGKEEAYLKKYMKSDEPGDLAILDAFSIYSVE
ncbi:hypothetical protein [Guggenheimella bovis]